MLFLGICGSNEPPYGFFEHDFDGSNCNPCFYCELPLFFQVELNMWPYVVSCGLLRSFVVVRGP
jgi:hypothetical protein